MITPEPVAVAAWVTTLIVTTDGSTRAAMTETGTLRSPGADVPPAASGEADADDAVWPWSLPDAP